MDLTEKTVSTKEIFKGKVIEVRVEDVELPNGEKSTREIVKHPGAVAIIALTEDNKIVMVEQFRKPLERVIMEIPAGKLEENEDPLDSAKRELEEETGYLAEGIEYITSFYVSPGFADELVHIYFTNKLKKSKHGTSMDEDEFLNIHEVTLEEANDLMEQKMIYDAKTVFAVQYLQLKERDL